MYSFLDFRRPTIPFARTRQTRRAAQRNWLGPTLISTWFKFANGPRYYNPSFFFLSYLPSWFAESTTQPVSRQSPQTPNKYPNPIYRSLYDLLLPLLCSSRAYSNKTQSEESQSNPFLPRRLRSNSTALGTSTQDARATLLRPNRFQRNQQFLKQKRREKYYRHHKSVRRPRYNTCLIYQLTNAFSSWEIVFWDYKRQEYTI